MKKSLGLPFSLLMACVVAPQLACSSGSSDGTPTTMGGSGGAATGGAGAAGGNAAAGASGTPTVGQAGGASGGASGSAGASGGAPSGGAPGSAGSAGSAGNAGSAGSTGQGGAAPFGPIKCTPTGTGDGTHSLPSDNRGNWQTINTNMANALTMNGNQVRLNVYQATCADTGCAHYPPVDGERDLPNALRWMFQGCTF